MKSIDEAAAPACLDEILGEAKQQPIRRQGAEIAILLSIVEYERIRDKADPRFLDLREESLARRALPA